MDTTTILIIIAAVAALALAIWCLVKVYQPIKTADVVGLDEAIATGKSAYNNSLVNSTNISAINDALGAVAEATDDFTSLAAEAPTPTFPLELDA